MNRQDAIRAVLRMPPERLGVARLAQELLADTVGLTLSYDAAPTPVYRYPHGVKGSARVQR